MHELGVVSEAAARFLEEIDGRRVEEVTLELGHEMELQIAEAAWEHVTRGTPAAGAQVQWVQIADQLVCFACSVTYHGGKLDTCPECGGNGLVIGEAPQFAVGSWRGTG